MIRNTGCRGLRQTVVMMLVVIFALGAATLPATAGEVKKFTMVNVLVGKTKVWLPSSITVYEGDEVEISLDNKLTEPHGFKLAAYDIEVEVPSLKQRTVRFTATSAGAHSFSCQLHAAHVGGQIVVLSK